MPPEIVSINVKELVELRQKAVAHDDYVNAIKLLKLKSYSTTAGPADFLKGYNAAILDLSDAVLDVTLKRMDREGVFR